MSRMHKLYRFSCTTGKCEDCGLIDGHSNACHEAAPFRQIEALYDKLEASELQIKDLRKALNRIALLPGLPAVRIAVEALKASEKRLCEHVYINYQCEKCGAGDPNKGVFCLEHRRVMTNGTCPKCGKA
jgi:hypothetical protein